MLYTSIIELFVYTSTRFWPSIHFYYRVLRLYKYISTQFYCFFIKPRSIQFVDIFLYCCVIKFFSNSSRRLASAGKPDLVNLHSPHTTDTGWDLCQRCARNLWWSEIYLNLKLLDVLFIFIIHYFNSQYQPKFQDFLPSSCMGILEISSYMQSSNIHLFANFQCIISIIGMGIIILIIIIIIVLNSRSLDNINEYCGTSRHTIVVLHVTLLWYCASHALLWYCTWNYCGTARHMHYCGTARHMHYCGTTRHMHYCGTTRHMHYCGTARYMHYWGTTRHMNYCGTAFTCTIVVLHGTCTFVVLNVTLLWYRLCYYFTIMRIDNEYDNFNQCWLVYFTQKCFMGKG